MTGLTRVWCTRTIRRGAMAVMTAVLATSAGAQVMDQVPSDAMMVARVKNVQAVSDKAGALAKQWGLAEMNPAAADPLGFLMTKGNLTKGIDKAGDFAIVVTNNNLEETPQPPVIMLVPVSDYDQFISNFAGAAKDGDLDHFKMKMNGEDDKEETYSAHWGKYAALTPTKDLLSKKPDGFKTSGVTAKELETKDAVIVVNFKVLGPKLNEKLTVQKEKVLGEVEKTLTANPEQAKYASLAKVVVTQGMNAASEFLTDTQYASYSINLSKDGILTTALAEFGADTYLGKNIGEMKGESGSLLTGLPEAKYLFLAGFSMGEGAKKMVGDAMAPIEAELAKSGDQMKPVIAYIDSFKKLMNASKGPACSAMVAPTGAPMATALIQTVGLVTGDPKAIIENETNMLKAQQELMAMLPNQPKGGMKVEVKSDAKTVDGVSFTQLAMNIGGDENTPEAMQVKQMLAIMYGPNGANVYMGPVDDQHVLVYTGLDDAMVSAAIKSAKAHTDTVSKSEGVMLVDKNLPETKLMVGYVALGDIVSTVAGYAKMMGMPIPISIKPNLPPIAFSVATEGPSIRADTFIPSDLVEQTIATVLQLRMMGGGGNGKPGGL